jgi:hypothetical protein
LTDFSDASALGDEAQEQSSVVATIYAAPRVARRRRVMGVIVFSFHDG